MKIGQLRMASFVALRNPRRDIQGHVVVMDFLGDDGWPSPLLKNAEMNSELADRLYRQIVLDMRRLYRECRLVHADLSEYNLILHREKTVSEGAGTVVFTSCPWGIGTPVIPVTVSHHMMNSQREQSTVFNRKITVFVGCGQFALLILSAH